MSLPRPDPRGPQRLIIAAEKTARANIYTLSCGHVSEGAVHFHLDTIGMGRRCFACGKTELAIWLDQNKAKEPD